MKTVCVFLGSNQDISEKYHDVARDVGKQLAEAGLRLVFGGCAWGTMRTLSKTVVDNGGEVVAIIEDDLNALQTEDLFCTELIVTKTLAERKDKMYEMADVFITLPGGIGTLDEYFFIYCENCLSDKPKPSGLLNLGGFYDPIIKMIEVGCSENFISDDRKKMLIVDTDFQNLLKKVQDAL